MNERRDVSKNPNPEDDSASKVVDFSNDMSIIAETSATPDRPPNEFLAEKPESSAKIYENDSIIQKPRKLKKRIFWLISIANATAQRFYGNFFSPFAAEVGVSGSLMGFLTSIRNLVSSLFQGNIGRLSDRFGRKYLLLLGVILSFAITIPLIFLENIAMLIVAAVIQALAVSIFIPVWNATQGDVTEIEGRAAFIGKLASVGQILSVAFTLLVAAVFYLADEVFNGWIIWGWEVKIPWRTQYSISFTLSAINFLICIIAILFIRETTVVKERKKEEEKEEKKTQNILLAFKDKAFIKVLIAYPLSGLVMSAAWPLIPIIQVDILNMSFSRIAVTSSIFAICMSIFQIFGGRIGDKIGRKPLIVTGVFILIFFPVSYIPAVITNSWLFIILASIVGGVGSGIFYVTVSVSVLDLAPENMMGTYSGLKEVFYGIATFLGSLSAGFISDAIRDAYSIQTMAIAMTIGISILRFFAAFGFLFIKESLPRDSRITREGRKKN